MPGSLFILATSLKECYYIVIKSVSSNVLTFRSSCMQVFGKRVFLQISQNSQVIHLCQSLVNRFASLRPATLFKKSIWQVTTKRANHPKPSKTIRNHPKFFAANHKLPGISYNQPQTTRNPPTTSH